jgi:SAM-dependent methyltransferase
LDTTKLKRYERLDAFLRGVIAQDVYPEVPAEPHISITAKMIAKLDERAPIKGKRVLDVGCGQGLALELFVSAGAHPTGIAQGEDVKICRDLGYDVYEMDQSFLDFSPASFDVIWCRHALEHSIFPLFTLCGFHESLVTEGLMYVEIPAPSTSAGHETNPNHYSCFTAPVWKALFRKAGFEIQEEIKIDFLTGVGPDTYHAFFLLKALA